MSDSLNSTGKRKQEHLRLCREHDVQSQVDPGWSAIRLPHRALPELKLSDVSLATDFLGQKLQAPLLISSMTGGSPEGETINARLAACAERHGLAMGVGSQRVQLEARDAALFELRRVAPRAVLYANIGLVQLNYGVKESDLLWLVEKLQAQALILHCNVLQECIQHEGDRDWSGLLNKIPRIKNALGNTPLILKETGCGLDALTCVRAREAGVDALDIAGLGGTHWGWIEGLRAPEASAIDRRELGALFRDWGIPSAEALQQARLALGGELPLIASGGIRSAVDAAKALYLGANLAGMALPFLQAAHTSEAALERFVLTQLEAFKIALFCTGSSSSTDLRNLKDPK